MKFAKPIMLFDLLRSSNYIDKYEIIGNENIGIGGINDYQVALPNDITWVDHDSLYKLAFKSPAICIIIDKTPEIQNQDKIMVVTQNPLEFFNALIKKQIKESTQSKKIRFNFFTRRKYTIGKNCYIGSGVKIGNNVVIGDDCVIYPNVVIYDNVYIGNRVLIHANSVIGADAFAYIKNANDTYQKRISAGNVIVLDDVEIGACCTIDKGITNDTILGQGAKMDDQVHIGHDTWIGSNCYLCGQVAIAGYVRIMNNCTFWGKSAVKNSIFINNNTTVLANTTVFKDILEENQTYFGIPATKSREYWKEMALFKKIIKKL